MKVLIINWDDPGVFYVKDENELDDDDKQMIQANTFDAIVFDHGEFKQAIVEEGYEESDDEDEDEEGLTTYDITEWKILK